MKKIVSLMVVLSMVMVYLPSMGGITIFAEEATEAVEETTEEVTEEVTESAEESDVEWEYSTFTYDNNTEDESDDATGIMVTEYKGTQTDIYVPAEIDSLPVLKLGDGIFKDNTAINSVTLSSNIKVIGKEAFSGCSNLVCIVTNEGLTEIEENAFLNCVNYNSVILYEAVTVIEDTAFSGCENLTIYCVENSVAYNFTVEKGIKWVLLGSETEPEIYTENGIEYYIQNGEAVAIKADTTLTEAVILANVNGYPVKTLRETFKGCGNLKSVKIPNSVTTISAKTFYQCYNLTHVTIPDGVTVIESMTFYNCSSLTNIVIHDGITAIGDSAFSYCGLTSITIPDGVTSIGSSVFSACNSLTSVTIPEHITVVPDYIFFNCKNISSVILHKEVTSIGKGSFSQCFKLTSITLPDSVTSIGEGAFRSSGLASITIPDSVTSIGKYAFSYCDLISIEIPYGITKIDTETFRGNESLMNVTIPDSVTHIGNSAFADCSSLKSIVLPYGVKYIGQTAFYNCTKLESITIPESVTEIGTQAFYASGLTSITIPDSVTIMGEYVFYRCRSLKSAKLSKSIAAIPNETFNGCVSLTEVVIPEGVTRVNSNAFYDCTSLISVSLPDSMTWIGPTAFYNCSSLTDLTIGENVTTIAAQAFYGCTSLLKVKIPEKVSLIYSVKVFPPSMVYVVAENSYAHNFVKENDLLHYVSKNGEEPEFITSEGIAYCIMNEEAIAVKADAALTQAVIPEKINDYPVTMLYVTFANCSSLKSVTIPDSVTSIGKYTFYNCRSLKSVTIPKGVTNIGKNTFQNCTSLTDVNIPNGVTAIGEMAFSNCTSLLKLRIPKTVETMYVNAFISTMVCLVTENSYAHTFAEENGFLYLVVAEDEDVELVTENKITYGIVNSEAMMLKADVSITEAIIPSTVNGFPVTKLIGTFRACANLTDVVIPEGVTSIADNMFEGCTKLKSVTLPGSITSIGEYTFYNCSSLKDIIIPDGVKSIGDYAFSKSGLNTITLADSITQIGDSAFSQCLGLRSITIPKGVTQIGKSVFSYCECLTSVTIHDSVTSIGDNAFYKCLSLSSAIVPEGVIDIGNYAFGYCNELTGVVIPATVKNIGNGAFSDCYKITSVTIPEGVTSIAENAFLNCTGLKSVMIPESVTEIGKKAFYNCNRLEKVILSEGVTTIEANSFLECIELESVKIPPSVSTIYTGSFWNNTIWIVEENSYAHTFAVENDRLYFVVGKVINPEIAYGASITGTVTDESGNTIAGATVEILYDDGTVKESVVTDETGAYSFTYAEVGRYTIRATDEEGNSTHETVSIKRMNVFDVYLAGETDLVITSSYTITGSVTGGSEGVATITNEDGVVIATSSITGGEFTFDAIPNGEYVIKAETESGVAVGEIAVFGEDAVIELTITENTATVTGCVKDEYGNVRNWARVTFYNSDGVAVASTKTDKDGIYTVTGLEIDEYAIVAESGDIRHHKHHDYKRSYTLKGYGYIDVTESGDFEADVIIVYDENDHECSVEGKVTAQGSPQVSEVVLHDVFRNEVAKYETGNNGKYKFVNIKDGLYFITARTEDNGMGMTVVSVRHGRVHGKTDIWVGRPDKIKEHEDRRHEIGDCSSRDEAMRHKDKIIEEKRFYDSLSKKEKKHCSKDYVDWLHRMIEWINEVEYEVKGDEPDAKFEHGGSMVDCDEIENEEPVKIEITIEKKDACSIGEEGVTTEDEFIQQSIEDAAGDGEIGQHYNITMRKGDGENYKEVDNIHRDTKTTGKMRITMPIPEEYRGYTNYCFIHVHNGEAVTLIDLDDDPDTITFETDKFSTFALMWHDKPFVEDVSKEVVKIGDVTYTSLQEAIDAAETDSTITLCDNVTLGSEAVVEGKNITIDMAGYTITGDDVCIGGNAIVEITGEGTIEKISIDVEEDERLTSQLKLYDGICDSVDCGKLSTIGVGEGFKIYRGEAVGTSMVEGAQVRIGEGVGEDGKVTAESGLRFVTTLNLNDSLVCEAYEHYDAENGYDEGYEIGVKITAEESDEAVYIKATKWQEDGAVFTTALTKLATTNFNRKFTATAYVKLEGVIYETNVSTARSIYQVAAGLLTETYANNKIYSENLLNVLNAYVNQTGIRLVLDETNGFTDIHDEESTSDKGGKYSGNAFFEITSATIEGDNYIVTIKPIGINTCINTDYFGEYIRINNNNSKIKDYVEIEDNGDNTYTITFAYGEMSNN